MATIANTWVEKIKKKKVQDTAPSYEYNKVDTYSIDTKKPKKRFTIPSSGNLVRTLRGVRK